MCLGQGLDSCPHRWAGLCPGKEQALFRASARNTHVSFAFWSLLQSEGQVLKEATYINKSLSFLEQIVIALADPKRDHIPFRQSKLTHVLKDSLGKSCGLQQPQIKRTEGRVSGSLSAVKALTYKHVELIIVQRTSGFPHQIKWQAQTVQRPH